RGILDDVAVYHGGVGRDPGGAEIHSTGPRRLSEERTALADGDGVAGAIRHVGETDPAVAREHAVEIIQLLVQLVFYAVARSITVRGGLWQRDVVLVVNGKQAGGAGGGADIQLEYHRAGGEVAGVFNGEGEIDLPGQVALFDKRQQQSSPTPARR